MPAVAGPDPGTACWSVLRRLRNSAGSCHMLVDLTLKVRGSVVDRADISEVTVGPFSQTRAVLNDEIGFVGLRLSRPPDRNAQR